jgi:hypothetical protein
LELSAAQGLVLTIIFDEPGDEWLLCYDASMRTVGQVPRNYCQIMGPVNPSTPIAPTSPQPVAEFDATSPPMTSYNISVPGQFDKFDENNAEFDVDEAKDDFDAPVSMPTTKPPLNAMKASAVVSTNSITISGPIINPLSSVSAVAQLDYYPVTVN